MGFRRKESGFKSLRWLVSGGFPGYSLSSGLRKLDFRAEFETWGRGGDDGG